MGGSPAHCRQAATSASETGTHSEILSLISSILLSSAAFSSSSLLFRKAGEVLAAWRLTRPHLRSKLKNCAPAAWEVHSSGASPCTASRTPPPPGHLRALCAAVRKRGQGRSDRLLFVLPL